jgi:8-oxo-dGTP diphosphatase
MNCVNALIINDKNEILVVWNKRYGGWTLPGGKIEPGEAPEVAMLRELREETGLVDPNHLVLINRASFEAKPEFQDRTVDLRLYRVYVDGTPREAEEGCPVRWMRLRDLFSQSVPFGTDYETLVMRILRNMT